MIDSSALLYLDSSAAVKLVKTEAESPAMYETLARGPQLTSSALLRTELMRSTLRSQRPTQESLEQVTRVLSRVALMDIDDAVLAAAGSQRPTGLGSLDAIHLATALALADDLSAVVTYDRALAAAATAAGLRVLTPV